MKRQLTLLCCIAFCSLTAQTSYTPPSSAVRTPGEWEEIQALAIAWDPSNSNGVTTMQARIVEAAKSECKVIILCKNYDQVIAKFASLGIDISQNVEVIEENYNTIWIRDYGGNSVYTNDVDSLLYIDWIYNRPRPKDDAAPVFLSSHLNIPLYQTLQAPLDLVHTGGNFMADGLGMAFSSNLVLDENGSDNDFGTSNHSEVEVDAIMQDFMGINTYPKMEALPYDGIHHIDMHMKLLDETTLLVGQYPEGVADGPQIEANIQYILSQYMTAFGTPFRVVRIPMPPENGDYPDNNGHYRTYTNAVFANKTILVPTYEEQFDTTALRIWRETMPGYNVVGINSNATIGSSGAIHCITKEVNSDNPLWIVHNPLVNVTETLPYYEVSALIKNKSGINNATLYYSVNNSEGPFIPFVMTNVNADNWVANIPNQLDGSTIYYYINATANNGKTQNRPMPAPEAHWQFTIEAPSNTLAPSTNLDVIFPNPAKAITCIPVHCNTKINASIELYDMLGNMVQQIYKGNIPSGDSKYFINAANIPTGTYSVVLRSDTQQISQQLMVIH